MDTPGSAFLSLSRGEGHPLRSMRLVIAVSISSRALRTFIEAMNGKLVIAARFADGVEIPIRSAGEDAA
jgi:hypothetical protein